jgi:hypothetical protein
MQRSILKRYPELSEDDVVIRDDCDGNGAYIDIWNSEKPCPSMDTVRQWAFDDSKETKMTELEASCDKAIVAGFDHTINDISYRFSCSLAAQANFQGSDTLFKDGIITEVEWTVVNNSTGATERITFGQDIFNQIKLKVFPHINSKISYLRNTLQVQVAAAATQTELDAISW